MGQKFYSNVRFYSSFSMLHTQKKSSQTYEKTSLKSSFHLNIFTFNLFPPQRKKSQIISPALKLPFMDS